MICNQSVRILIDPSAGKPGSVWRVQPGQQRGEMVQAGPAQLQVPTIPRNVDPYRLSRLCTAQGVAAVVVAIALTLLVLATLATLFLLPSLVRSTQQKRRTAGEMGETGREQTLDSFSA